MSKTDTHFEIRGRLHVDESMPPKPLTTIWIDADSFRSLDSVASPVLGILDLGRRKLTVWVEPLQDERRNKDYVKRSMVISRRMLTRLALLDSDLENVKLNISIVRALTGVMSVSEPLGTSEASVSFETFKKLGETRFALVQGKGHALFVHLKTRNHLTADNVIRLNYNARTLLGIADRQEFVDLQRMDNPQPGIHELGILRASLMSVSRSFTTAMEAMLRFGLGAPRVALAVRVASDGDDEIGICRCAPDVLDRIGIVSGGSIRISWGLRTFTTRIYAMTESSDRETTTFVVEWGDDHKLPPLHENQYISVPSGVRSRLGVPRDGVVEVRRSMAGILRRRFVDLAVPVVGIVISIGPLGLSPWVAGALFVGSFVLILAGERLAKARKPLSYRSREKRK